MRVAALDGFLAGARFYQWFQDVIGGTRARQWTVERYIRVSDGQSLLDLGCGPGDLMRLLPRATRFDYVGLDISDAYLARANEKDHRHATFILGDCTKADEFLDGRRFNWIVCLGLLHHLDDQQCTSLLRAGARLLAPGGSVICLEPTFLPGQSWITRAVMRQDRGQFVRTLDEFRGLYERWFSNVVIEPLRGAFRIPYEKTVAVLRNPRD